MYKQFDLEIYHTLPAELKLLAIMIPSSLWMSGAKQPILTSQI